MEYVQLYDLASIWNWHLRLGALGFEIQNFALKRIDCDFRQELKNLVE